MKKVNNMTGKEILNELGAYKQGMQISEVKKKYDLKEIIKLSSNENPYGYSSQVKEAFSEMTLDFELYPDGYGLDLRTKLAEMLLVKEEELIIGAGSDEIISFITRAFLYPGTNTVMATPTFSQYRQNALIEGAALKEVPTKDGKHDLVEMANAIDENTKVVWLCSPDNPTGDVMTHAAFTAFMDRCPEDVLVVLDEAYYEYVPVNLQFDLLGNLTKYKNLIVLRTLSKAYGLAGLRVGYGITTETIAEKLNIIRGPFNTTSLTQRMAITALEDQLFITETKAQNAEVLQEFSEFLETIDWKYYTSHTNFILVETPIDSDKVAFYLLKNGFIVRPGTLLGYPGTIRITIGKAADMKRLQIIIHQLIDEINDGVYT